MQGITRLQVLLVSLLAVGFGGCTELDATQDPAEAVLSGAFTADRTDDDLADFSATMTAHGIESYALMESYPEQFRVQLALETCYALRSALVEKEYLGHVSGCARL